MIITVLQNRCFEEASEWQETGVLQEMPESEAWKAVGYMGMNFGDNKMKWKPEFINEFSPIATKEITPSKENGIMTGLDACEMVFAEFQGQENTNPEWNIIEKSHRSLSVGDIVKFEGREVYGTATGEGRFFMVEINGFSEFEPEEIAEDSSPDNGGDDRDAKIDAMQKQIDSLRAMVLSNQSHCKKTHMSAYQASKESLKELKKRILWLEEMDEGQGNLIESLEERIEKLEAHLGEDDDDTPRWLKGKTIHEQINQVNKDSTDDCENLRGNAIQSSELLGISLTEMNTKIKELQNINPLSVSDVVEIVKEQMSTYAYWKAQYAGIDDEFKDIWKRLNSLVDVHLDRRLTKLEKLESNGVTVREFDKLHEEVNDIHLSLVESEKKLKSQVLKIVKEQRKHWDSNISILTARLANSQDDISLLKAKVNFE